MYKLPFTNTGKKMPGTKSKSLSRVIVTERQIDGLKHHSFSTMAQNQHFQYLHVVDFVVHQPPLSQICREGTALKPPATVIRTV